MKVSGVLELAHGHQSSLLTLFEMAAWSIPTTKEAFMKAVSSLHPDLQAVCE